MFYALRSDRYKFIMCTNGRCGSTLTKQWYLKVHGLPLPALGDYRSIHASLPYGDPGLHVDRDGFNESPYFKFVVARNPWERLVSFYKSLVVWDQQNHEGMGRGSSFSQLIKQIEKTGGSDAHVIPQTRGLEGLSFDRVVHLENIALEMESVCAECDIEFDPGHFSEVVYGSPVNEGEGIASIPTSPGDRFVELNYWPEWRQFYTQELADIVSRVYADDIKAFGYGWDSVTDSVTGRVTIGPEPALAPAPAPEPEPEPEPEPVGRVRPGLKGPGRFLRSV